jgi:hypothetical protein
MSTSPFPRRPLTAGGEIDAWCTRCKMDLGHRIVAMVGAAPKRVLCMTCNSEHNYRSEKKVTSPVAKTPRAAKKATGAKTKTASAGSTRSSGAKTREEWEKRVRSGEPLTRYTISDTYDIDQLVSHKKCGDGYVCGIGDGKVIIMFIDGEKTLIQGVSS